MLNGPQFKIIFGQDVVEAIRIERDRTVRPSAHTPGCYDSESVCAHQRRMASRGYLGAELVKSIYGYSVRYDSGLQNWGILAGSRSGQLDGSFEDAVRWAKRWQENDPTRRYVWTREG